jgi:hypothetical protein
MKNIYKYLNTAGIILAFLSVSLEVKATEGEKEKPLAEKKMDHASHKESKGNTIKVEALPLKDIKKGKTQSVKIKLTSLKDKKEILLSDLKEVHTKKIHLLIFDQTLTDYQHVHPTPTQEAGVYQFEWAPQNDGLYRLWVDVVSVKSGEEEYIKADLATVGETAKELDKKLSLNEKVEENWYSLSFDTKDLKKGQAAMGTIKIVDSQGHGVKKLEPIMGAFAHIVAINENFQTIAHVHPMGEEPSSDKDRGGPELMFHFEPEKAGYYKLWLQVQLDGKDVFVPFGIEVK